MMRRPVRPRVVIAGGGAVMFQDRPAARTGPGPRRCTGPVRELCGPHSMCGWGRRRDGGGHDQVIRHIRSNGGRSPRRRRVERGSCCPGSRRANGCGTRRTPGRPFERAFEFAAQRARDRTLARTGCGPGPLRTVCSSSRLADPSAGFARSFGACASASPRFRCSGASLPPTRRCCWLRSLGWCSHRSPSRSRSQRASWSFLPRVWSRC